MDFKWLALLSFVVHLWPKLMSFADSLNWPKDSWVLLLQSVLVGKAQEIYRSLSVEQSSNYEHVKEAILKAYE